MYFRPFVYSKSTTIFNLWMFAHTNRSNRPLPRGAGGLKSMIFAAYRMCINIIHSVSAHI